MLDKEFHQHIVKHNGTNDRYSVAYKLTTCAVCRNLKGYMAIEPKASKECYRKDDNKRGDMWRYDDKSEVDKTERNNIVVDDVVPHGIERHIGCTTHAIAE